MADRSATIGGVTIAEGAMTGVTSIAPSTDLAVADGGTGASTAAGARTNLLPSKTGNALKVLRVNAGETDYELATAAGGGDVSAAANITDNRVTRGDGGAKGIQESGVTIDDSANMTGVAALGATTIELGHASDTTIARSGAGDIAIEGNAVYRAGGTDVPVADGGTGASTAAGARTNLGAEPITCIARAAAAAAVAINSTSVVNMASCTNTVAAGDTFSFYMSGYVLNNSGAIRTYTVRVTIGATTFDLAVSPTYAASAANVGWLNSVIDVAIISTSSIACTIQVRAGASAAVATIQNNVLAQDRNIVHTSTNNETGSKTIAIGILSNNNTATQTFTKTRVEIYKGGSI